MAGGSKNLKQGLKLGKPSYDDDQPAEELMTPMGGVKAGFRAGAAMGMGNRGMKGMALSDQAEAGSKPTQNRGSAKARPGCPNLGGMSGRGSGKAAPSYSATSGNISKPDKSYTAAQKKRGDDYLTDYGVGAAVNAFANKKKK